VSRNDIVVRRRGIEVSGVDIEIGGATDVTGKIFQNGRRTRVLRSPVSIINVINY